MTIVPFTVDPDIALAQTMPGAIYTDPTIFALVRERVFAPSWQFIGDTLGLSTRGQLRPFTLLPGFLNEPLLLTRDYHDVLRCISNVCTHRGTILCEKERIESTHKEKGLVCRYHGRRFNLDGTFRHMPEFENVANFPDVSDNLAQVSLESWGPWLFASLQPEHPCAAVLEAMRARLGWLSMDGWVFDAARSRDYVVSANWALYVDNYLEGFHIPFVHGSLNQVIDYGEYTTELFAHSNLQLGIAKSSEHCFDLPPNSPDFGRNVAAYYWWLFPNMMFNFYPWGLSVNVITPLAPDSTRISFYSYVQDASKLEVGAGSELDRVEHEDEAVVEAVQRGIQSRLYKRGRYSPTREQGVHHFHRLLCAKLFCPAKT